MTKFLHYVVFKLHEAFWPRTLLTSVLYYYRCKTSLCQQQFLVFSKFFNKVLNHILRVFHTWVFQTRKEYCSTLFLFMQELFFKFLNFF